jgi:hypothetical protein
MIVAVVVAALGAAAPAALAAGWTKPNVTSAARGKALTMPTAAGTTPSTTRSGADVTVTWAQNNFQGTTTAVPKSKVFRYATATGGTAVAASASCSGQVASGCVESAVPLGTWFYTEKPSAGVWDGVESARTTAVAVGSLAVADGGGGTTTRQPDSKDTLTITFPARLQASTLCSSWTDDTTTRTLTSDGTNPGPLVVTFTKGTGGSSHDTVSITSSSCGVGGLNVGSIDLGTTGYLSSSTAVFNSNSGKTTLTYTPGALTSNATLQVKLGAAASGTPTTQASSTNQAAVYAPPAGLKYAATGTPAVTGSLTSTAGPLF